MVPVACSIDDGALLMNNLWFIYLLSSIGKAEEDLDVFENDGFAVDDAEDDEEEEGGNTKQAQNKKKKTILFSCVK